MSLKGGLVYANYGRPEDFAWLRSVGVSAAGCVVVMRVGGEVSFAEKVWLAQRNGGGGALIYPDPADLPQDPRRLGLNSQTAVSEHVCAHARLTSDPELLTNYSFSAGAPGLR